ncbi:hypothetical protein [Sphingomonas sp. ERG5]|uniref:hypothetical protein n=1 Tax=Sphingomonas sp. ERG5 TaxID=1381597 RepID=UPI001364AD33|nr:hypothetical protein [Sphingomonas sp. ERG5]
MAGRDHFPVILAKAGIPLLLLLLYSSCGRDRIGTGRRFNGCAGHGSVGRTECRRFSVPLFLSREEYRAILPPVPARNNIESAAVPCCYDAVSMLLSNNSILARKSLNYLPKIGPKIQRNSIGKNRPV